MSWLGAALWNLLLNAMVSLAFALAFAALAVRLVRVKHPRLAVVLLTTPFMKAVYEIARGIPSTSFFWAKLGGAAQDMGTLRLGLGVTAPFIPNVELALGVFSKSRRYDQSIADAVATGLSRHGAAFLPAVLGICLATLISLCVLAWAIRRANGRRACEAILRSARLLETRRIGWRTVRIAVVEDPSAVPFALGLLRPWICIPKQTLEALSREEREAVIAHELAHHRFFDGPLLTFVEIVATAFWFVPGARASLRAIRAFVELGADAAAARSTSAATLASALVRVAELAQPASAPHALAFLHPSPLLSKRVNALLASRHEPHALRTGVLLTMTFALAATILKATTFGNP